MKIHKINSKLYHFLLEKESGEKLIAIFATLKVKRGKYAYYKHYNSNNNKVVGGYTLLKNITGLSKYMLKKYVPKLVELGLVEFKENGDVHILGNKKINERFESNKLVPIKVFNNLTQTKYAVFNVLIVSNVRSQQKQVDKKTKSKETLKHISNPHSLKELKKAKRLAKKFPNGIEVEKDVVLSNKRFGEIRKGESSKHVGLYFKQQLQKRGFIKSKQNLKFVRKISHKEYLQLRKCLSNSVDFSKFRFVKGGLYIQKANLIEV